MEYGQDNKIKVCLLCFFSNEEVRDKIKYSWVKRIITKYIYRKNMTRGDFAPWVTSLIEEFEKRDDVELNVISPIIGGSCSIQEFRIRGVNYYFYPLDFTLFLSKLIDNVNVWLRLQKSSFFVNKIINKIKPDIVNLIGAENYYHACAVLGINDVPVYVCCQTIYGNPRRLKHNPNAKLLKNWIIEDQIIRKEKYFGCLGLMYYDLLVKKNPDIFTFPLKWVSSKIEIVENIDTQYDFVTFAKLNSRPKGSFDVISAFSIVLKSFPDLKLNIAGGVTPEVYNEMKLMISELGIEDNVVFTPFFEKQEDLFTHLIKSRIAVLPIKLDLIPYTVIQAMTLGLPVITNRTTGTPLLNKNKKTVLLTEIDNIDELALNMLKLIKSENLYFKLRHNALEYINEYNNREMECDDFVQIYKAVIDHFKSNIMIPSNLIFDPNKYPKYD